MIENNEGLTLRELKHNLKLALKNSGVVNEMKATIRSDFCKALTTKPKNIQKDYSYREILLLSSIFHHLKRKSLLHSLSVFQAESGLDIKTVVSESCINEALYTANEAKPEHTSLDTIFDTICTRNRKAFMTSAVQTEAPSNNIREVLNQQVQEIRRNYIAKKDAESLSPSYTIEEKMLVFERECELRLRREYDSQFSQLKDIEIARVRSEEASRARMELDTLRKQLESDYQRRMEAHVAREELSAKTALERERSMQQAQYEYRQRTQREVDELRDREQAMAKKHALEAQGLSLLELRVKESISALESRERDIFRRERETDMLVKEYQERARIEARNHLQDELDAVLRERSLVRMERQRVEEAKATQAAVIEDLALCRAELKHARGQVESTELVVDEWQRKTEQAEVVVERAKAAAQEAVERERETRIAAEARLAPALKENEEAVRTIDQLRALSVDQQARLQKQIDRLKNDLTVETRKASALSMRCEELDKLLQDHQSVFSNLLHNKKALKQHDKPVDYTAYKPSRKQAYMQSAASSVLYGEAVKTTFRGEAPHTTTSATGYSRSMEAPVTGLFSARSMNVEERVPFLSQPSSQTMAHEFSRVALAPQPRTPPLAQPPRSQDPLPPQQMSRVEYLRSNEKAEVAGSVDAREQALLFEEEEERVTEVAAAERRIAEQDRARETARVAAVRREAARWAAVIEETHEASIPQQGVGVSAVSLHDGGQAGEDRIIQAEVDEANRIRATAAAAALKEAEELRAKAALEEAPRYAESAAAAEKEQQKKDEEEGARQRQRDEDKRLELAAAEAAALARLEEEARIKRERAEEHAKAAALAVAEEESLRDERLQEQQQREAAEAALAALAAEAAEKARVRAAERAREEEEEREREEAADRRRRADADRRRVQQQERDAAEKLRQDTEAAAAARSRVSDEATVTAVGLATAEGRITQHDDDDEKAEDGEGGDDAGRKHQPQGSQESKQTADALAIQAARARVLARRGNRRSSADGGEEVASSLDSLRSSLTGTGTGTTPLMNSLVRQQHLTDDEDVISEIRRPDDNDSSTSDSDEVSW